MPMCALLCSRQDGSAAQHCPEDMLLCAYLVTVVCTQEAQAVPASGAIKAANAAKGSVPVLHASGSDLGH